MSIWKQLVLSVIVLAAAAWGWAAWLPGGAEMLRRAGLGPVMDRVGLAEADLRGAAPAQRGGGGWGGAGGAVPVIAEPPRMGRVADSVSAIGDGRALRAVAVVPQSAGRIAEVLVASGERVDGGQVLARLEDEAERIALERARLLVQDARERVERMSRLRGAGAGTDVQAREAELALRQAELALRQAEFDLAQRQVLAPIGGWIGIVNAEVGAQVGPSSELAQIDDRSALLVDFRLPERMVGRLQPGDAVAAQALASGFGGIEGRISAIDNRVDPASRTLRVQARFENPDDRLRAGMAFSIRIDLPGEPAPAIDPLALQWSRDGAFVWVVREGKARRLPVRILQRNADAVLVSGAFQPDDLVITEGVLAVRPGAEVDVRAREQAAPARGGALSVEPAAARL